MHKSSFNDKKCFTQYSQHKRTPIEYYLHKISLIKNDPCQLTTFYREPKINSRTEFASSYTDLKKHHELSLEAKRKDYQKKRSLSTKTEIDFAPQSNEGKFNAKTQYGVKKFHEERLNLFSKISIPDSKIKQRTVTNFKVNVERRKNPSEVKHHASQNKILTEPSFEESIYEHSHRLVTEYGQEMTSIKEEVEQNMEEIKKNIFIKISLYVKSLDEKGEEELNEMLVGNYKKNIKCHTDVVLYEEKIKQMIKTNKEIVEMLKEEFLSPRKVRQFSERNVTIKNLSVLNLQESAVDIESPNKKIVIDELEVDLHQEPSLIVLETESKLKPLQSNITTKPIIMETSQSLSQLENIHNSKETDSPTEEHPQDYNEEMKHVTNEFVTEWEKSKTYKKEIYQKFRKTLFKKFPEFRQRELKRNKELNIKPKEEDELSDLENEENDDIFKSKIHLDGLKEVQEQAKNIENKNKKSEIIISPNKKKLNHEHENEKNLKELKDIKNSEQKEIQLIKNSSSNQEKDEIQPLKKIATELSKSLSKITLLSKKNSLSKGSARTLSILTAENKKEVDKFNFESLVEFIFKRAFFYSVSKKKIIQNKTEITPLEIVSPVEKKKPDFSFITYNSKAQEKRHLRISKLNEKKLRATGNFLIKNKFNIMQMEQEGCKSYDFLRKCIEDSIEDYLNMSKKK